MTYIIYHYDIPDSEYHIESIQFQKELGDFLLFTGTIQKTAESAEARREKQHISAPLCGESFLPRFVYLE